MRVHTQQGEPVRWRASLPRGDGARARPADWSLRCPLTSPSGQRGCAQPVRSELRDVDDAVHGNPHNVDKVPVQDAATHADAGVVVARVHGHGRREPARAQEHVHAVEAGGDVERGAVGAICQVERRSRVLEVLVTQEEHAQGERGAQRAHDHLGVLGHHGHVGRVVRCRQHGRHDERALVPTNGLNADRWPLHLDAHVGRHAQVHACPQQPKEQRRLGHNEQPHTRHQVALDHLSVHAHV
mmetsp:Transcript_1874/g.4026  ORF Transcript_1874/g.4026 Transcript_1874/m.4026 type:complete len:241 (-) Transcript_1874:668-1390(-)